MKIKNIFKWVIVGVSAIFLLAIGYIFYQVQSTPKIDANLLTTHAGTKITDNNGEIIWQNANTIIYPINNDEVPELYKKTIIATEDKNFEHSSGVNFKSILNAGYGKLRSIVQPSYKARGGSTIEQQLIKNTYYNGGRGVDVNQRKIQEWFLARQLNSHFNKDEIFNFYINKLEYSENAIGIKSAMKVYFNKNPEDFKDTPTDIAQIAYLSGLSQAPSLYNLYTNPEKANERTQTILKIMLDENIINNEQYNKAKEIDLTKTLRPRYEEANNINKNNIKYKAYAEGVLNELRELDYNINNTSLTIKTYLDKKLFNEIDAEVKKSKYYQDDKIQIGMTIMKTDGIVTYMLGSRFDDENNRAMSRVRSSGSSLKPFTAYGPLFEYFGNKYSAATVMSSANYQYPGSNAIMYNYGKATYGNRTLTDALRLSLNTPVGRIDDQILGSNRMKAFLHANGLDVKETYSSVDGIGLNVSTLDSAAAYNALNNLGEYTYPRFIDTITFIDGSQKKIEKRSKISMRQSTAFVLLQMLRGVTLPNMTAKDAYLNKAGYAVKTGSVAFGAGINPPAPYGLGGSDVWINSVTNGGISISMWLGYDTPNTSPQVSDKFKGHHELTKKLQEIYGGNAPMWNRPNTVVSMGGSGINEMFAVTDAKDTVTQTNILNEITLPEINEIEPEVKANKDWKKEAEKTDLYKLWKKNHNILDELTLSEEDYDTLRR